MCHNLWVRDSGTRPPHWCADQETKVSVAKKKVEIMVDLSCTRFSWEYVMTETCQTFLRTSQNRVYTSVFWASGKRSNKDKRTDSSNAFQMWLVIRLQCIPMFHRLCSNLWMSHPWTINHLKRLSETWNRQPTLAILQQDWNETHPSTYYQRFIETVSEE